MKYLIAVLFCAVALCADPLPSWNKTDSKKQIIGFVEKVTDPKSPDFVPRDERIAVFDNDGTLWSERPVYFQLIFIFDQIKKMAPDHPEWQTQEPYASVLKGDYKSALSAKEEALVEMALVAHSNMTGAEFKQAARAWLDSAEHPKTGMLYKEMVFQPMLELLAYLRAKGFKTFIVSGGGVDFIRVFAEETYGIPPEQVVGTTLKAKYEVRDGKGVLVKEPEIALIDDKAGKPVGIYQFIGRRPIFAAGNSDGDFEMLEYTTTGEGPRFGMLVHHNDSQREWAYDRESHVGQLNRGLDEGPDRGWLIVDMKNDWAKIYPSVAD
ncbi:HAD family hydrolase [Cerasicoccus fimbriatus]|uniref:HAD family hydrolase n=1 Tax=Cerasicoccus fimbriatus TaxID=3014554 RepID=UPI0022B329EB|nr:HAD family hydrolase [Cerasicoccus sp. TK19100]